MACFVFGDVMFDNDMIMSLKQKEINFIPRIKLLSHNMYLIEKNIVAFFSFQFIFLLTGPPRLAIAILRASLL